LQPAPTRDSEPAGIVIGALLMICSLEFVGAFEQEGWKLAGVFTPSRMSLGPMADRGRRRLLL
jgi:hypothetical protein